MATLAVLLLLPWLKPYSKAGRSHTLKQSLWLSHWQLNKSNFILLSAFYFSYLYSINFPGLSTSKSSHTARCSKAMCHATVTSLAGSHLADCAYILPMQDAQGASDFGDNLPLCQRADLAKLLMVFRMQVFLGIKSSSLVLEKVYMAYHPCEKKTSPQNQEQPHSTHSTLAFPF